MVDKKAAPQEAEAVDWQRVDDALVSCAGLLKTLCRDEIGDTAAAELEYVRSALGCRPPAQAATEAGIEAAERTMAAHYERPLKAWELTALHEALKAAMEVGRPALTEGRQDE